PDDGRADCERLRIHLGDIDDAHKRVLSKDLPGHEQAVVRIPAATSSQDPGAERERRKIAAPNLEAHSSDSPISPTARARTFSASDARYVKAASSSSTVRMVPARAPASSARRWASASARAIASARGILEENVKSASPPT